MSLEGIQTHEMKEHVSPALRRKTTSPLADMPWMLPGQYLSNVESNVPPLMAACVMLKFGIHDSRAGLRHEFMSVGPHNAFSVTPLLLA